MNKIIIVSTAMLFTTMLTGCPKQGPIENMMDCTADYCEQARKDCDDNCQNKGGAEINVCSVGGDIPTCRTCRCKGDSDISNPIPEDLNQ